MAVDALPGLAHYGDDLLDTRRVRRVAHPLVPRRAPEMELGGGRRRAAPARHIDTESNDIDPPS